MAFHLRDIIDLEFFFNLDEQSRETGEEDLSARDREIFKQINAPKLSDTDLVREWLSYRKLLFFHQTSPGEILPGSLFASLTGWAGRGLFFGGLILGLAAAYSFLAYHGTRPVNVTVFTAVFILLQALVSCLSLGFMARQVMGPGAGRPSTALFHALISGAFFKKLGRLYDRAGEMPGGKTLKEIHGTGALMRQIHRTHSGIMFWPFFILSTLFALGFSCGALGGTLFRVTVTDLAFGWQSTLLTSGSQVHEAVRWIALPWSWALPSALPGLEQIEGSRIILKEGMAHLATEHLTAWWPFLCMGLLTYGVLFRLLVAGLAFRARSSALAAVAMDQPRFRRLLVRMRSPNMETLTRDRPVSRAEDRFPLPRPGAAEDSGPEGVKPDEPAAGEESGPGEQEASQVQILVPEQIFSDAGLEAITTVVEGQLGLEVRGLVPVSLECGQDRAVLEPLAAAGKAPVIFLQEVWQPPIRGLLYYYSQVKETIFPDRPVWILLTRTPGEENPGVPADDMNYKVWKKAVSQLGCPGIFLERILP